MFSNLPDTITPTPADPLVATDYAALKRLKFTCARDGCDPRPFTLSPVELFDADGWIACEYCAQPCTLIAIETDREPLRLRRTMRPSILAGRAEQTDAEFRTLLNPASLSAHAMAWEYITTDEANAHAHAELLESNSNDPINTHMARRRAAAITTFRVTYANKLRAELQGQKIVLLPTDADRVEQIESTWNVGYARAKSAVAWEAQAHIAYLIRLLRGQSAVESKI